MLVSVGTDKLCKIWDISANASADGSTYTPACIQEKDMKQGDLFSVQMYADIPWVLATGGQKGELAVWDTEEDQRVLKHFKGMLPQGAQQLKRKADRGLEATDADMAEGNGDSSGFEDVDSDEDSDEDAATQEEVKKPVSKTKATGSKVT